MINALMMKKASPVSRKSPAPPSPPKSSQANKYISIFGNKNNETIPKVEDNSEYTDEEVINNISNDIKTISDLLVRLKTNFLIII